ncbi:MAG: AlpA family phage regulatory protein [Ghiorsea sp.]
MNTLTKLPETGFIRLKTVIGIIGCSKTAWYDGIREGRYPKQIKLSERSSAWRVEDIRKLIAELGGEK